MATSNKSYPVEIRDIEPEQVEKWKKSFRITMNPFTLRFGPKGYLFPREFENVGKEIYNMDVRPNDTFVVTFPKSGTTWTQELVWLILNNFDYEKASETPLTIRYPFLETEMFFNQNHKSMPGMLNADNIKKTMEKNMPPVREILNMASPRYIKSHLPLSLLPPKLLDTCKVFYVARDPRDVVVSFYHHKKFLNVLQDGVDFKAFWELFIIDLLPWAPFFEHVKEAWRMRNHPNMLFLFYEDLSKDLRACVRRIAKFLDKEITEEQIGKLCEHVNIDNFKKNKSVNFDNLKGTGLLNEKESFIRKGKVGGWRDYFDEEMTEQAQRWIEENLRDTDLRFPQ
ncbi:unnamed protein product [Parnassius mnemosyne]|uniref:Sulfotransferase domain-containing protein n=1 Tax=Parnassius mnemosyne TaxID=213953 RepID=A0AAV1KH37_9NEOP